MTTKTQNLSQYDIDLEDDDKDVTVAIECLRRAIQKVLYRYELKRNNSNQQQSCDKKQPQNSIIIPKSIDSIVQQMKYCFLRLRKQLQSLQCGIQSLQQKLHPLFLQNMMESIPKLLVTNDPNNSTMATATLQSVIQHLFLNILRLQDGIILCVSGECRHIGDIHRTKETMKRNKSLRSQLNSTNTTNSDNTRRMYSTSNLYSGTSWDEYMDPSVGIQVRLLQEIRKYARSSTITWEKLGSADLLDNILNTIEYQMKDMKDTMTKYCKYQLPNDLKRAISSSSFAISCPVFQIVLTDKLEKLNITLNNTSGGSVSLFSYQIQRYGNQFQIKDINGLLPLHWNTVNDWYTNTKMASSTMTTIVSTNNNNNHGQSNTKKTIKGSSVMRRRVIADSSCSSDEDYNNNKVNSNNNNRTTRKQQQEEESSRNSSVGAVARTEDNNDETGLVVRVKTKQLQSTTTTSDTLSVAAIKKQLGVDTAALEASREVVEAEEAQTLQAASIIDNGDDNDDMVENNTVTRNDIDTEQSLQQLIHVTILEQRIKRCRRILRNELSQVVNFDEYSIWDARETLRHALMEAGNHLLWWSPPQSPAAALLSSYQSKNNDLSSTTISDVPKKSDMLQRAIQCFLSAKDLVTDQQKLHHTMTTKLTNNKENSNTKSNEDNDFFQRNLLLLKGQALNNAGIAYIEFANTVYPNDQQQQHASEKVKKKRSKKDTLLRQAIQHLDETVDVTKKIIQLCQYTTIVDSDDGSNKNLHNQVRIDTLRAMQLESLALRWKATALWHLYQHTEAYNVFTLAGSVSSANIEKWNNDTPEHDEAFQATLLECQIECHIECYYAWTQLADLCTTSLECATIDSIRKNSSPSNLYDTIVESLSYALHNASNASKVLYDLIDSSCSTRNKKSFHEFCHDKDVRDSNDLISSLKDIIAIWERKKACAKKVLGGSLSGIGNGNTYMNNNLSSRSGLQALMDVPHIPTKLFTLNESTRRQNLKKPSNRIDGAAYSAIGITNYNNTNSASNNNNNHVSTKQYRKWGDDLLPQIIDKNGKGVLKLEYPSIAPEMPSHIRDMLEQYRQRQQHQQRR